MLMPSLQRPLHKDEAGRRIAEPVAGPLFSGEHAEVAHREVLHKIGVTNITVAQRIAGDDRVVRLAAQHIDGAALSSRLVCARTGHPINSA